jgi:hypothetical protein
VHHRLADPPQRGRLKIRTLRRIETSCCFDQAEIAFVNQIEQRHAEPAKALRISNDHPQICLHQTAERNLITMLLHAVAELLLVVARQ